MYGAGNNCKQRSPCDGVKAAATDGCTIAALQVMAAPLWAIWRCVALPRRHSCKVEFGLQPLLRLRSRVAAAMHPLVVASLQQAIALCSHNRAACILMNHRH